MGLYILYHTKRFLKSIIVAGYGQNVAPGEKSADIFSEKHWTKPAGYDIIFMVEH